MFTGIINFNCNICLLKLINKKYFLFIKIINKILLYFNISESISVNGVCLTLIYKNFNFLEFELSLETLYISNLIENEKKLNTDIALRFYSKLNGGFNLGHVNNFFFIVNIYKFLKNYIFYIYINKFMKFFIYKNTININGINLTLNQIEYYNNCIILKFNIINYTYKFTSLKYMKLLNSINLEIDILYFYYYKNICIF